MRRDLALWAADRAVCPPRVAERRGLWRMYRGGATPRVAPIPVATDRGTYGNIDNASPRIAGRHLTL